MKTCIDKNGFVYICSQVGENDWVITAHNTQKTYNIKTCDFEILGLKEVKNEN